MFNHTDALFFITESVFLRNLTLCRKPSTLLVPWDLEGRVCKPFPICHLWTEFCSGKDSNYNETHYLGMLYINSLKIILIEKVSHPCFSPPHDGLNCSPAWRTGQQLGSLNILFIENSEKFFILCGLWPVFGIIRLYISGWEEKLFYVYVCKCLSYVNITMKLRMDEQWGSQKGENVKGKIYNMNIWKDHYEQKSLYWLNPKNRQYV